MVLELVVKLSMLLSDYKPIDNDAKNRECEKPYSPPVDYPSSLGSRFYSTGLTSAEKAVE